MLTDTSKTHDDTSGGASIGAIVRRLRTSQNLTQKQLADDSGLSSSTISRIESGLISPTYDALVKLATGLKIDIETLFNSPAATTAGARLSVTRNGDGLQLFTDNYKYEMLCANVSRKRLIPLVAEICARTVDEFGGLLSHDGEEFIYVLSGQVGLITELYEPILLSAGDGVYFDSIMKHACLARSVPNPKVLWISTDSR